MESLLGYNNSFNVLSFLDDPADFVHLSSVSHWWRQFVIENGFCKKLFYRMHPEVLYFVRVVEVRNGIEPMEVGSSNALEWESLERDHRVYADLAHRVMSNDTERNCIEESISASSTDNYPRESIKNTLEPKEVVNDRPSYWSSKGKEDPEVPETLIYKLVSNLCVINEINIRPFEAYFQPGQPIYSAKAVRFKMGHRSDSDDYIWTYISPEFPMSQENRLQTFKLPRPVICVGGTLQIELLGRVQRQETDNLYYICVCHVEAMGQSLRPAFDVERSLDTPGNCILKYFP